MYSTPSLTTAIIRYIQVLLHINPYGYIMETHHPRPAAWYTRSAPNDPEIWPYWKNLRLATRIVRSKLTQPSLVFSGLLDFCPIIIFVFHQPIYHTLLFSIILPFVISYGCHILEKALKFLFNRSTNILHRRNSDGIFIMDHQALEIGHNRSWLSFLGVSCRVCIMYNFTSFCSKLNQFKTANTIKC